MDSYICPSRPSPSFRSPSHPTIFCKHQLCLHSRDFSKLAPPLTPCAQKFSAKLFCASSDLRSCGDFSSRDHFVTPIAPPQLHTFSLSGPRWPESAGASHRLDCRFISSCRGNACLRSSPLQRQMSTSGDLPDPRQRILAAAGHNMAIETDHGCSVEQANTQHQSDQDLAKSTIPGIICPSVKTVGKSTNIVWQSCSVKREEKEKLLGQRGCVVWFTGLSGSGKTTIACALDRALLNHGKLSYVLDGDNVRHGLNKNLGFSAEDRSENIRRIGEVAKIFVDAGVICIASAISPYRKDRDACRKLLKEGEFIEVYMNFPLEICEERDPKGLYKLARAGKIKGFTGIDDPYEAPLNSEVVMEPIDGKCPSPADMATQLVSYLEIRGFFN